MSTMRLKNTDTHSGLSEVELHLSPTIQAVNANIGIMSPFPVHQGLSERKKSDILHTTD